MNKKTTYVIIGVALVLVIIFFTYGSGSDESASIIVDVSKGEFIVDINVTGELESRNSVKIMGPGNEVRQFRIYGIKVENIIPEGTVVKKGDFVASLDQSELSGKIKDKQIELETAESQYITVKLDTTLEMREKRDELVNLKYDVEEKQLVLDQSQYEPPAIIKKNEIAVEKSKRAYDQKTENYQIKKQQNVAKMVQARAARDKVQRELDELMKIRGNFRVLAPEDGMVIYAKSWDGKPIKTGSQISTYNPVVATLPDLTTMNSKTYVNEVDIRRIKKGQVVDIGLDAFPDKKLTGKITRVANAGQKRPNSDSKVFEVMIEIDKVDQMVKPGMTTSNKIYTAKIDETLSIPLECLQNYQDSISFVFIRDMGSYRKQEVQIGETNATHAQVLLGIGENDKVYMSMPNISEEEEILLLPELDGKRNNVDKLEKGLKDNESQKQFPRKPKPSA
ncbi:efflux RND transporter periplasmic adaptor subunit [Reichenbachiella sp. MALMAid0571]|uniref:efflux RND transporter periplasmic adaptor subunit n=1 Tax=Reichenbachiella sp. MALMAid0571 TaxID=3143939 RepID=UPI0032E011C9